MLAIVSSYTSAAARKTVLFTKNWQFVLGDTLNAQDPKISDALWKTIDLPHDWSIEGAFSKDHPSTPGGGALPGGTGWYRKTFSLPEADKNKLFFIDFDGVYRNSEVWINGHYLGKRPYGYISFRYELTPFLHFGKNNNTIAVRVDNSKQPNSRWYSGSGIYRNVWLVSVGNIFVDHWGTYVTTPIAHETEAKISVHTKVKNASARNEVVSVRTQIVDASGKEIASAKSTMKIEKQSVGETQQSMSIANPLLWSIEQPSLYKAVTVVECKGEKYDDYVTTFGVRYFNFDKDKGFFLNGKSVKINGVCNHHDLGCLGAAVNLRALERQLEILKGMGVNGIRTSHNPPAPELLDLCDRMGFIVMDEAFDMWKKKKTEFDYSLDWDEWHQRDLEDMVVRDRNHPSIFIWSIGNEVMEQWDKKDSSGILIARELASIVKKLDPNRPITAACNDPVSDNPVIKSNAIDLIGYNYSHDKFSEFPKIFPGKSFIGTETVSGFGSRGHYDMPSDSIRRWPKRWDLPLEGGNPDNTCSSYDNCSAPWGSTQEETWKVMKRYNFLSGQYIWTGFDYIGEPTPYSWPSRSSYFGIVDLAGFPKDAYYMYQSEWTDKPMLHLFPHWNWKQGDTVDVWVYTNCEGVELFLNGESKGIKKKVGDGLHVMWRVAYMPGTLKAIGRAIGKAIVIREIKTAGIPAKIVLEPDRSVITADGKDLSFVTVKVLDKDGVVVPQADNLIHFTISDEGKIAGVDNGLQTSLEPFKANFRRTFNGLCLVIVQSKEKAGQITLEATSDGLKESTIVIETK